MTVNPFPGEKVNGPPPLVKIGVKIKSPPRKKKGPPKKEENLRLAFFAPGLFLF